MASTLQARKQQLVRDAIWDAAIDLFSQKGFDETTVDDIAEVAGVSRRSFFRYFSSKSDLLAQGIVSYGTTLTDAIRACPRTYSLPEVFRETMLRVAQHSAAQPRTREIMQITAQYPAAREAQLSRVAEVQDQVAEAFLDRCRKNSKDELTAHVLAALTLSLLGVTFRSWFDHGRQNISATVDQVLAALSRLICEDKERTVKPGGKRARRATRSGTEKSRSVSKQPG